MSPKFQRTTEIAIRNALRIRNATSAQFRILFSYTSAFRACPISLLPPYPKKVKNYL
jgi:hypothetical protein